MTRKELVALIADKSGVQAPVAAKVFDAAIEELIEDDPDYPLFDWYGFYSNEECVPVWNDVDENAELYRILLLEEQLVGFFNIAVKRIKKLFLHNLTYTS